MWGRGEEDVPPPPLLVLLPPVGITSGPARPSGRWAVALCVSVCISVCQCGIEVFQEALRWGTR
jgi:hypothetical protein